MSQNISTTTLKKVEILLKYILIPKYLIIFFSHFKGWCESRIINQTLSLRYYYYNKVIQIRYFAQIFCTQVCRKPASCFQARDAF